MNRFEDYLLKAAMLAQEDPMAPTETDPAAEVAVDTCTPQGVDPLILYPWIAAQLAVAYVGSEAYGMSVTRPIDILTSLNKYFGAPEDYITKAVDEYLAFDFCKGYALTRMIGFGTAGVGAVGAALAFVKPEFFPFATYASVLGAAGVVAQSFLTRGWYDKYLDKTDTTRDTAEKLDENFTTSKNYLLFGGLVAVAIDAYVIAMPFLSGPPAAPAEEVPAEVDPNADANAGTGSLIAW